MYFDEHTNDNNQPTTQTRMSSIMRSESMPVYDNYEWNSPEIMETLQEEPSASEAVSSEAVVASEAVVVASAAEVPEKKKIMAPPMKYDLREADSAFVYGHIRSVVKNDAAAIKYLETVVRPALFAQRSPIVFGYIPAPPNADATRMVIGKDGHFFKMTTACCNVYFIWHEMETNTFLFWGPSIFKTVKAMNSIRWRIFKYYEKYGNGKSESNKQDENDSKQDENDSNQEDDDDYADMPKLISSGNTPDYEHPEQN
jgi:hypothetical protein